LGSPTIGAGCGCGGEELDSPGGELWLESVPGPEPLPPCVEPELLPSPSPSTTVEPSSCVELAGGAVGWVLVELG
jgi:hypothetical protein